MTQSARDRDEPANANLPVQEPWFQVTQLAPDLFRITEPRCHRWVRANSFLILGRERDILVDSGMGVAALRPVVDRLSSRPRLVSTTHAHIDHVGCHPEFPNCEILVHPTEADELARPGRQGSVFRNAARRRSPSFAGSAPMAWHMTEPAGDNKEPASAALEEAQARGLSLIRQLDRAGRNAEEIPGSAFPRR